MASAVVVALIVGLAIILCIHFLLRDDPAPEQKVVQGPNTSAACELPVSDQTGLTSAPDADWRLMGAGASSFSVPVTTEDGPSKWEENRPSCWRQSPTGAVLAASTMAGLASSGNQYVLYEDYSVEGENRDRALREVPKDEAVSEQDISLAAFRLVDYRKDSAQVEVVVTGDDPYGEPVYIAATFDLVYDDGDWKFNPPSSLVPTVQQVKNLDGYIDYVKGETNG